MEGDQRFGYETTQLDKKSIIVFKAAKKIFDKKSVNSIKKFVLRRPIESRSLGVFSVFVFTKRQTQMSSHNKSNNELRVGSVHHRLLFMVSEMFQTFSRSDHLKLD